MSSISSVNTSAALLYQMQQAAANKQAGNVTTSSPSQQTQGASNDSDHDGDSDGTGIDTKA
jgi:hypothetical protein